MKYHIKEYLKNRGYNLSALAKSMDMSFQRFDHHIKEREDLSYNFVCNLADKLDIDVNTFITQISIKKSDSN